MTAVIEGLYKQGKIELLHPPPELPEGRVRVIVIAEQRPQSTLRLMTFGMFPGDTSTLEDFKEAQWHGDQEWDDAHGQ